MQTLQVQSENWKQIFESYCQKAFPKVRVRKRLKPSAADSLVKERNCLKKRQDDEKTSDIENLKIIELEEKISDILAQEEIGKISQLKKCCAIYGSVCVSEMWKTKKSLWPKKSNYIPIGKINHEGKLLTGPEDIKKLLEKEYSERLRPRPTHPHLRHLDKIKLEAFEIKLKEAKLKKSDDWTMLEIDNVLKNIKKNKSRDPDGLSRSIFHIDCIGSDLKHSLLIFF